MRERRRGSLGELIPVFGSLTCLANSSGQVTEKKNSDLFVVDTVGDVAGELLSSSVNERC